MTLLNSRCLKSAGAEFFIPPYGVMQPTITPERKIFMPYAPFAGYVFVYNKIAGRRIDLGFNLHASSTQAALNFRRNLESALNDSTGNARDVEFCEWSDTDSTNGFFYRGCQVIEGPNWDQGNSERFRPCSFSIFCPNPTIYHTWANGDLPGTSPYAVYLLPASAGGPVDDPDDPGEVAMPFATYQVPSGTLPDVVIAGDTHDRQIDAGAASFNITGIHIAGCGVAGAGPTTIRVSDSVYGGGGNYLEIIIAADAKTATRVTGEITVANLAHIYVYVQTAGGHADISYELTVEST